VDDNRHLEFPQKPDLTLYIGKYVEGIVKPENALPWQWGIRLENGVEIRNKDRRETFVPTDIVGKCIMTISFSVKDTTITFSGGLKWSLNPTQYAVHDPQHGGEVYPQWPVELEEAGIPSHPMEGVSDQPDNAEGWEKHRRSEIMRRHEETQTEARNWLEEDSK
jgi:hypothetical protein